MRRRQRKDTGDISTCGWMTAMRQDDRVTARGGKERHVEKCPKSNRRHNKKGKIILIKMDLKLIRAS